MAQAATSETTSNSAVRGLRGFLGSGALVLFLSSIADFKTWQELVVFLGSGVGGGALLWAVVEVLGYIVKQRTGGVQELNSDFVHYFVLGGAILLPAAIYGLSVALGWVPWNTAGVLGAVAASRQIASTLHWETEDTSVSGANLVTQPVKEAAEVKVDNAIRHVQEAEKIGEP